jgi:hypothetical protein
LWLRNFEPLRPLTAENPNGCECPDHWNTLPLEAIPFLYSQYPDCFTILKVFSKYFHIDFESTLRPSMGITIFDVFSIGLKVSYSLIVFCSVLKVGPITSLESTFPDPGIFWGRATFNGSLRALEALIAREGPFPDRHNWLTLSDT